MKSVIKYSINIRRSYEKICFTKSNCLEKGKNRKPLLLYGICQVGKTWLTEEFRKQIFLII